MYLFINLNLLSVSLMMECIMLKFNVPYLLNFRGVKQHYSYLRGLGFSNHKIRLFLKEANLSLKLKDIEFLCVTLKCTPNDLFNWEPNWGQELAADHPLHSITKHPGVNLADMTSDMSVEEIAEFTKRIAEVKKEIKK